MSSAPTLSLRGLAMAVLLGLPLLLPRPAAAESGYAQVRALYHGALEAREKKDYPAYYDRISRLQELLPSDSETIFRRAGAAALTGRTAEAGRLLKRLAAQQAFFDLAGSPDLAAVRGSEAYKSALAAMAALKRPVGTEVVAFRLEQKDFVPEAVAWDAGTRSFLVSSVRHRKVVRVGKDGKARDLVPEGSGGLWSALGIAVDSPRRTLYVCSSAHPQTLGVKREDIGKAALFAFHADSGKLLGRWPLDGGGKEHACDSVAVSSQGVVYVTDSATGEVSRLRWGAQSLGKSLESFLPAGALYSAQSPAFGPGEKVLFVGDYVRGVFRVDLATRRAVLLPKPEEVDLNGIDGMVYHDGSLIAVQNGLEPARVLRLRLSPGLDRIVKVETLARGLAIHDDPTLAAVVDGILYYVANSHWNKLGEDGTLKDAERLTGPVVLRVPLGH
jgi:sugar lactone lactonase YvrE